MVTPSLCRQLLHHVNRRRRAEAVELLRTGNCLWGLGSVSLLISPSREEVGCCCGQQMKALGSVSFRYSLKCSEQQVTDP